MLHQRLVFGSLLTILILGMMFSDAYLSEINAPVVLFPGTSLNIGAWACNGLISTLVVLVLTGLAARELTRFAKLAGARPFRVETQILTTGLVVGPFISFNLQAQTGFHDESWGMLWLAFGLCLAFLMQTVRRGVELAFVNLSTTLFVTFYAGGLAGFMTKLRMEVGGAEGVTALLFSMFVVKITDVGAFFSGLAFGRNKLIPWLSPKKTWEGLAGGVAAAVIASMTVGAWLHRYHLLPFSDGVMGHPWALAMFGLLMAAFAVAGDLFESLLKRDVEMKDSSDMIPGMGGALDILDSPLLAAPAAWFFWTRLVVWTA